MKRKLVRYIGVLLFSLIVTLSLCGGSVHAAEKDAIDNDYSIKGLYDKATGKDKLDKKIEETKETDPTYKEKKKKEKTKQTKKKAYAFTLFKDSKKNQKLMYYKAQTGTKAPTVESKIEKASSNKQEGTEYASFLHSLDAWNLYNVQSTQQDSLIYWFIAFVKGFYGTILLGCFKLLTGLEAIKNLFADLMDQINVWKFITDEGSSIPKDSPFYFLHWVVDIYHKLTNFAKVAIALFLGWIAFMLASGVGKAKMRGHYAKNNLLKVLYAFLAMVLAATFASMSISVATDMLRDSDKASTKAVEKIPQGMIVDTRQYIDNSLTDISGKKGAEGTNDGYVLNHEKGFPSNPDEVQQQIPTKKLVNYMNTNDNNDLVDKLDGGTLLYNWSYSVNLNANDISTMYKLNQKAEKDNNMNYLAFKLAPQADGVKLTGGKEFFGTELKDAQVTSASLAGSTGGGVFLNAVKMGAIILIITGVIVMLYLAIFMGFVNALKDFAVNVSFSQMGLYQAFFGVFITGAMLILSIQLTLFLIQIFPDAILAVDESFTEQLNNYDDFDGTTKQLLQTAVTLLAVWVITVVVWKTKKGVMKIAHEFFNRILDGMNPDGAIAGGSRADKKALENAMNSNLAGQDFAEGVAHDPYGAAKNGLGYGVDGMKKGWQSIKDLQAKDKKEEDSVMSYMQNGEENEGQNGKKSSDFSGYASSSQSDSDDIDANSKGLEQDINEGLRNLEDTSEQGVAKNLDERDESIANATNEFEKLNASQQEVQEAKDDLAQLKASGATPEEISAAEQRVEDAEREYNSQLGRSQEASRLLSRSGAGIEDIGASKAQAMRDYHDASGEIESAEQKVVDLTSEREELEAFGASQAELAEIDNKINMAKDEVASGKVKQKLAQDAYDANVINPTVEKEARTNLAQAQESQIMAERELEQATTNGNLTNEEYTTLQKAATSLGGEVSNMKSQIDSQIRSGEVKQNAIKHMQENGGTAFTTNDIELQQREIQNAEQQLANIQTQYEEAKANPSNNSQRMTMLSNELSNAKSNHVNLQKAQQTMNTGKNVGEAIKAQQQVVTQAYERKVKAEQVLEQLESQEKAGEITDRSEMKNAVAQVKQAQVAYSNAGRVMSGLNSVKSVGHTKVPEVKLQELADNNSKSLNNLYEQQENIGSVQNTIGKLETGGHADIKETHALSQIQKQARRKASEKVKEANDRYNDLQQKIAKLKRLETNGVHVQTQVDRYQSSLRQTKKDLDSAKQQEAFISSQGFSINSIGNTMKDNYVSSKDKVKEMSDLANERQKEHKDILKTGGLSKDQLDKYKQQLSNEREQSQSDMERLSKDRKSKIDSIKKELDV